MKNTDETKRPEDSSLLSFLMHSSDDSMLPGGE